MACPLSIQSWQGRGLVRTDYFGASVAAGYDADDAGMFAPR